MNKGKSIPFFASRRRVSCRLCKIDAAMKIKSIANPSGKSKIAGPDFKSVPLEIHNRWAILNKISYPPALPISGKKDEIVSAIRNNQVVVITGETGSGKTTQIPKMCLEAGRGLCGMIGCTQPRRIAAITVARRIAEEMGEDLGLSVGYKIRFDDRTGGNPLVKIMTDGILLMETQTDQHLRAYDTIIVDEAHERSLNIDFILGILKTLLSKRSDLKLIITSATIDSEKFSRAFGDAPVIEVSGRMYRVDIRYQLPKKDEDENEDVNEPEAAVMAVAQLKKERRIGDTLIFMPTEQDIKETCEMLKGRFEEDAIILPLFSRLSWSEQRRIFQPAKRQKIIVATNIAETSLTIPGIRYVIDSGTARISQYNSRTRTNGLPVRKISRSSAEQRAGRCGRIENGVCIRLYSEEDFNSRPPFTQPEILRSNLAGVILKMLSLNLDDIYSFPYIDPPAGRSIQDGLEVLQELNAIERGKNHGGRTIKLTKNGAIMAKMPLDPRLSRMIIEADKEGCLEEVTVIAAALSVQDPRERPTDKEEEADRMHAFFKDPSSDFLTLLNIWKGFHVALSTADSRNKIRKYCREHFLSFRKMCEWQDVHEQIKQILKEEKFKKRTVPPVQDYHAFYAAVHKSILSGYLSNIAIKKEKNIYTATKGREVMLFPGSSLFNKGGNWIVAAEIVETSRLYARMAANIESDWLEALGGDLCRLSYSEPRWEKNRGEVVANEQVSLFGLVIVPSRSVSYGPIAPDEAGKIFIRQALVEGEIKYPFPFLKYNQELIESASKMENRLRKRELLAGDEELARFYEKKLPGSYNVRTLQKLIKDKGGDDFLRMQESDVFIRVPDQAELSLYPEKIKWGNNIFPLDYRFDLDSAEDGATIKIPVQLLPVIEPTGMDWAIPGLLREKIMYLLKGLPKEHRKKLFPLSGVCDMIMKEITGRQGHLLSFLADFIYRCFGVEIPTGAWPVEKLPEHLQTRFSIIGEKNKEVASGRDLCLLQNEITKEVKSKTLENARMNWEKTGISTWDFGSLPEYIALKDKNGPAEIAFPVLVAAEGGIEIRLFQNKSEAKVRHLEGVSALYALHFQEELKHLKKNIVLSEEMKAWAKHLGGARVIEASIVSQVLRNLFAVDSRTPEAFTALAEKNKLQILPEGQRLRKAIVPILKAHHDALNTLSLLERANRFNRHALKLLQNFRNVIQELTPSNFLEIFDAERLSHIPRYLKAITLGAQRGLAHIGKAMGKIEEVQSLVDNLKNVINKLPPSASEGKRIALDEYRWLIEEYRVSLFAQELKTPFPVSEKKLAEKMREIERMF
jgi:ATP-dependent helicase HrpA